MIRTAALAVAAFVILVAAPAAAMETTEFGIAPAEGTKLVVDLRTGRTTDGAIDLWNRRDTPITLRLDVVPATIAADGQVTLEGPTEPTTWVHFDDDVVRLRAKERLTVSFRLSPPRRVDENVRTVAILAEPVPAPGAPPPALLQRLAVVVHLERASGGLPELGPWGWVAGTLAVLVGVMLLSRSRPVRGSRTR